MIQSLLIANRGEIACRIIRTAREMGIRTVAVYSDADTKALHVREADEAVHIGPSPARESYLVGDKIIAAAKATGAEAIHPGYGFLSENAAFAQAVIDAGLIWVGPKPASITAMGLKDAAKKLMADAGVPVTPGYMGENQDPAFLAEQAADIGYPVLIKAVAGGGGKGMRKVDSAADFADALASCQREAAASFGNDHVLIEKYILTPRHIEVQVFGDTHGNVVHLFERDCSLQRRHQKVIEEAPAPGMDEATRAELCAAAVRAAKAVDYVGAGTIEFIADASEGLRADRIWFMEMNTRLQVEHPVTEEITGVDLVEWQLRVASGEPIPLTQDELAIDGWAMEARLYAEDPATGFLPSTGSLDLFQLPDHIGRVDTGVYEGAEVSPFYDPMIAKLIAHGEDRDEARELLSEMLEDSAIWPVRTNARFLIRALDHPDFAAGAVDTGLIGRDGEAMSAAPEPSPQALTKAAMAMVPASPHAGLRLNAPPVRTAPFLLDGKRVDVTLHGPGADNPAPAMLVAETGAVWQLTPWRAKGGAGDGAGDGDILAPMPGKVIAVDVAAGDRVARGQKLLTLEAMKMEHGLTAPFDGVVAELNVAAGAQVQVEALLVRVEPEA
ncbi:acetyl/propionyl/methylcrotonyl-CoA carboxylase subunit alpha [Sphingopyxis sp. MWB1]|uniref:acetyl/propionyl/methylcrotonyl-CoA carboxylase subunit alpha n=1 Tax=Sphingopyxis sp. MWB1 TaxID=1537715 RepID=UPI000519F1BB|nr:acetyl/propionyl/methylcrotonyl-CoA carboxylase subunit alpha [Sphingopyxis sp. MWB1]